MLTPRSILAVALIVTGAFASDLLAGGDPVIITVSTDGKGDYSKIQDAVDNASAGAIVRIGKGTWHEAVTVTQPLTLEGADWDASRIVSASPGQEQASPELVEGLERISRELDTETQAKLRQAFLKVFSSSPAVTVKGTIRCRNSKTRGVAVANGEHRTATRVHRHKEPRLQARERIITAQSWYRRPELCLSRQPLASAA